MGQHVEEATQHVIRMQDGSELVTDLTATEGLVLQGVMGPAIRSIEKIGPESGSSVNNPYAAADRSAAPRLNFDGSDRVAAFIDNDVSWSPLQDRAVQNAFYTAGVGSGSSAAAAAAAASASRNAYFRDENSKLDAQYRRGNEDLDSRGLAARGAYEASSSSANLAELAAKRAYGAEAAALDIKGATGQAAYNQSQLDRNLEGIGLGAMDYRRGESLAADPYRALEADQVGVASGQRRYAQDVRAAAVASEEKKIALAEKKVADAKAESDRALGAMLQGIQSSQRNSDRSYGAQIDAQRLQSKFNADLLALTGEGNVAKAEYYEDSLVLQQARWDAEDEAKGLTPVAVAGSGTTSALTAAQQWENNNRDKVTRTSGGYGKTNSYAQDVFAPALPPPPPTSGIW